MAAGLLVLLDDIASLLDDVAVYSKVAAKKTAGVLGDDLAVNAQQVSGVAAERELPIIWAVAKGSLLNKVILVPLALVLSALMPWLIPIVLMIGGAYLCYEGVEKLIHDWQHRKHKDKQSTSQKTHSPQQEKAKIRGAIRTDFILSIEIIVIVLGTVQDASLLSKTLVVALVALGVTIGVYAVVALIVKLDDFGLMLIESNQQGRFKNLWQAIGLGLLVAAPKLIKSLGVIGMLAMFLVGGGILVHHLPFFHHLSESILVESYWLTMAYQGFFTLFVGMVLGTLVVGLVKIATSLVTPKSQ